MTEERRHAIKRLSSLLEQENTLLESQQYSQVGHMLPEKHAALQALEQNAAGVVGPETEDDVVLSRTLARLADENRVALQRALRVQERIMGIMADAARRMMETPLYGGQGTRAVRKTGLAVAMIKQA